MGSFLSTFLNRKVSLWSGWTTCNNHVLSVVKMKKRLADKHFHQLSSSALFLSPNFLVHFSRFAWFAVSLWMSLDVQCPTGSDSSVLPGAARNRTWRLCRIYLVDRYIFSLSITHFYTLNCYFVYSFRFEHLTQLQFPLLHPILHLKIFYRALREIPAGEELSVWYSNALAQWYDIPTTATPTHDEKGKWESE